MATGATRRGRALAASAASACVVAVLLWPPFTALAGQEPHRRILADKFQERLERIASDAPGVAGIAVWDLTSGERFAVNDSLVFPTASAIKVAILVELYRQAEAGEVDLVRTFPIRRDAQVGGTGILQHFGDGTSAVSLRDLAVLMILLSDNTATNLLIDLVGMQAVNDGLAALGLRHTRLRRPMIRPEESARGNENVATPAEAASLMERVARCDLPVSRDGCAELRAILELPRPPWLATFPRPVPAGVPVAWKSGNLEGVLTAWALVDLPTRPYVLTVMVNYGESGGAEQAVGGAFEAAADYFGRLARSTPHGVRVPEEALLRARPPEQPEWNATPPTRPQSGPADGCSGSRGTGSPGHRSS